MARTPSIIVFGVAGGAASIVGIVCTVIGARQVPRSPATNAAISLGFIAAFGLVCVLVLGSF